MFNYLFAVVDVSQIPGTSRQIFSEESDEEIEKGENNYEVKPNAFQKKYYHTYFQKMNDEQKQVVNTIMQFLRSRKQDKHFFIDGNAGCGKTFVFQTLYNLLRNEGYKVNIILPRWF